MQRFKRFITTVFLLGAIFAPAILSAQPQQASPYSVAVTPPQASIEQGETLQLEAQLFDARGQKIAADGVEWSLKPDSLGEISDDGFFQAGKLAGDVSVLAIFKHGGVRYYGEASIAIGRPLPPFIKIEVLPQDAVVEPGGQQQYRVAAIARDNSNFRIDNIRWAVQPRHVGTVDQNGLFTASESVSQGQVIAYVDINRAVYRGAAKVTVSEKPTASLSGTVLDESSGQPIVGAHMLVQKIGPIGWVRMVRTDSMGIYVAQNLIPGLYLVRAKAKHYLTEFYDDKEQLAEANVLTVNAEDSLTNIDFELLRGGLIRGFVKSEADSLPIDNSLVAAVHVISNRKTYTKTHDDGRFEIEGLPAGDYHVQAVASGYVSEFYDNAQPGEQPAILSVTPPDVIEDINFYLATSSGIAGKVVDAASGEPLAGAKVTVLTLSRGRKLALPLARAKTDENGSFLIGVRPGSYFVFAEAKGYVGEYVDDQPGVLDADTIEVLQNAHTQVPDIALDRLGSIAGQVIDERSQAAIEGATIVAFLERDPRSLALDIQGIGPLMRSYRTRTDADGNYLLENLPAGNYFLQALSKNHLPEFYDGVENLDSATAVEVANATAITGIDFSLGTGGGLAGTVVDSVTGAPLAGATVTIWSDENSKRAVAFTERDGSYSFSGLPTGDYIAFARLKDYDGRFYDGVANQDEATSISITSGTEAAGIDFQLPKFESRAGTIAGVVLTEPDSNDTAPARPIVGAKVLAIPVVQGPAHFDITDALGNYRITRLVPGEYIVLVWARGHVVEFYDGADNWRDAEIVTAAANQVVDGIDFSLEPAQQGPYRIRGKVRRKQRGDHSITSSATLDGLVVTAYNDAGLIGSALTDGVGAFDLSDLPSGEYKIKINGPGFDDAWFGGDDAQSAQAVSVSSGRSQSNLEIEISETITSVESGQAAVPVAFYLEQNYPNPFNPETTIRFALAAQSDVKVLVYNLIGQRVRVLVDQKLEAGMHQVQWNGLSDEGVQAASGIYLLRFEAGDAVQTRRMILMK